MREPWNLGNGWVDCDLAKQFHHPVRMMNDAAMQALGSYAGGRMLYIGLGTSVGSAFVADHVVVPLELGSLGHSFGKTLEERLSKESLKRDGVSPWRKAVLDALPRLQYAFNATEVVLGGGNAKRLSDRLPDGVRLGDNAWAYRGGCRLWECYSLGTLHHFDAPLEAQPQAVAGETAQT